MPCCLLLSPPWIISKRMFCKLVASVKNTKSAHNSLTLLEIHPKGKPLLTGYLPVNTSAGAGRETCQINYEVPDLAEEVILVGVPILACIIIGIRIDHRNTRKVRCSLKRWKGYCITNELGVVQLYNRFADDVGTRGKVYDRWSDCARVAALAAAVSVWNGRIDCCRVVRCSVSLCTVVLNISVYFVRWVTKCNRTSPLDIGYPVARGLNGSIRCRWRYRHRFNR